METTSNSKSKSSTQQQVSKELAKELDLYKEDELEIIEIYLGTLTRYKRISHKERREIMAKAKSLDMKELRAYQKTIRDRCKLVEKLRDTRRRIETAAADRTYKKAFVLLNVACRLVVLAKELYKIGHMPSEDYFYLWNALNKDKGMPTETVNALNALYLAKLMEVHPAYSKFDKIDLRINHLLLNLDNFKPIIP